MSEGNKKQYKKRVKKKKKEKEPVTESQKTGLNLKCIVEGCESKRTFETVTSLASHIRAAHRKQYTAKQLGGLLMPDKEKVEETTVNKEEVKEVSEQKPKEESLGLSEVIAKIDEVNSKIPADLCDKFPELCKMGEKVDKLSGDVEEMKGNQIKKLVLQVPKPEAPPKVDLSSTDSKLDKINDSMVDVQSKLAEISGGDERPQTKKTKPPQEGKSEENVGDKDETPKHIPAEGTDVTALKEISKDVTSLVEEAVGKAVKAAKTGSDHHNELSADEIVNCPHCKSKILSKIAEKSKGDNVLDPDVMQFMETMGFVKKEEEKEGVNNADEETDVNKNTDEGDLPASAQSSPKAGDTPSQEVPESETNWSEQRTEGGQESTGAETSGKGSGASQDEGRTAEAKGEGSDAGSGSGDSGPGSGQSDNKPAEPKRCRLLFRPER